jgi:Lamin Tail Domain
MSRAVNALLISIVLAAVAAPGAAGAIRLKVFFDPAGDDTGSASSLRAEYVELRNTGRGPVALTNWTLRDATGKTYRFGRLVLRGGATVRVHTGTGANSAKHVFWGQDNYVWNNDGDKATLRNAASRIVAQCSYGDISASFKVC